MKKNARARMRARTTSRTTPRMIPHQDHAVQDAGTDGNAPVEPDSSPFSSFTVNKKDKQRIRHSALLHRIAKSAPGSVKKRRRPSKKLAADLGGLLGALPEVETFKGRETGDEADDEWQGIPDEDEDGGSMQLPQDLARIANVKRRRKVNTGKMEMKTMESRPGAMKKKAKLERAERDRFAKNMAQMAPAAQGGQGEVSSSDRWSALRGFIGQTMQQSPLFQSG